MSSASATEHASVIVQLEHRSPLRRIWRYVGYDEPNYTDTPNGHALLAKLAEMSDGPYYIRCHFILCSGDGTPNLTITLPSHSACLLQFVAVIQSRDEELTMEPIERRTLGETKAVVTKLGLGGAGLGDLTEILKEDHAQHILQAAWDGGVRYFDTSPFYGHGKSEHRMGHFLRQQPRSEFVISTKVGRVFRAPGPTAASDGTFQPRRKPSTFVGALPFEFYYDYSYDGVMRSYEDSLQRLGLPSIDLLLIHDLDFWFHKTEALVTAYLTQLATSGWRALEELRDSGAIKGAGAGINEVGMIPRFLDLVDLDFFLVALSYNLLDQGVLDEELPRCAEAGVGIVGGAIFASGILASGPVDGAFYNYEPASPEILEKTRRIEAVCQRHDTPLSAAAMQFPLAHPRVAAIIPGAIRPEQVEKNLQMLRHPIPSQLWTDLKDEGLLPTHAPTPA